MLMDGDVWKEYNTLECIHGSVESFWQSIEVWILKPHILNKKISAVSILDIGYHHNEDVVKCYEYFKKNLSIEITKLSELVDNCKNLCNGRTGKLSVLLRILYPKTGGLFIENVDLVIKDYEKTRVTFMKPTESETAVSPFKTPYAISYEKGSLVLRITSRNVEDTHTSWLCRTLLPKISGWMKPGLSIKNVTKQSNSLVPADMYISTYNMLKSKYFSSIKKIWTESTNPQKFIIEDIAIATYLIVLWSDKPQRFVDLGCGNGLLVYILNSEGHLGVGLDVRARKIWSLYPKTTVLKVCTIMPSLESTFPDVDWIIGNHSDELTPWIPVMAAKSSYKTNFFLLPCCHFEFNGCKYARTKSNHSCYEEYMDYIDKICQICGFIFERDRLKIPSTKRHCFVSRGRVYSDDDKLKYYDNINRYVKEKLHGSNEMKVRSAKEEVKNCTQLDQKFLSSVVREVASFILSKRKDFEGWREGEFVDLKDVIGIISSDQRQLLKKECGGLKTLLKNHHNIFLVVNGRVKLRKPVVKEVPPHYYKKKECWFYHNHPDSCPLLEEQCSYIHTNRDSLNPVPPYLIS